MNGFVWASGHSLCVQWGFPLHFGDSFIASEDIFIQERRYSLAVVKIEMISARASSGRDGDDGYRERWRTGTGAAEQGVRSLSSKGKESLGPAVRSRGRTGGTELRAEQSREEIPIYKESSAPIHPAGHSGRLRSTHLWQRCRKETSFWFGNCWF